MNYLVEKKSRVWCIKGHCRVYNERAEHCAAFDTRLNSHVRTCGACCNSVFLNLDGTVSDLLLEEETSI